MCLSCSTVDDFEKAFLALTDKDRMRVLKRVMPVFCEDMVRNVDMVQEMFFLFTEDCGKPMRNLFATMEPVLGRRGGGCCG